MTAVQPRDLAAALTRAGVPEADDRTRRRAEYSTDASNYRVVPSVVAYPRHTDEALAAVATAVELGVPVTTRGGGTSTAGNSIGTGLVLDFSRHLNHVLSLDPDARTAVVEPGAILDDITAAAAPHGLRYGPDPSTKARATIGGSIGNNACGPRAMTYGRTADNVLGLDVVTAEGTRFAAGPADARPAPDPAAAIHAGLDRLVAENLATVRTGFGRFRRQVSGYSLEHLLPENGGDVAKFLAGTEGTLAVLLGATVRLVESPPAVALCVLGYPDMPSAADAVPALLAHEMVALEGMDARLVDVVRRRRGEAAVPPLPKGDGWLFVETAGATEAEAVAAAQRLAADAGCLDSAVVTGAPAAALWRIRADGAGLGGRTPAGAPAWPGWEDAAVPPDQLGAYLRQFEALMRQHGVDGLSYGHFGDGCVHVRIDFPLSSSPATYRAFVEDAARLVGSHGGSMSGEHGDGRARGELLPHMYSPEAIGLFGAVKQLFDPRNLLNPGVVVDPAPLDADLRVPHARPLRRDLGFAYPHDGGDLSTAVHRCVGVGKCRADTTATGGVMCPSYLATRDEKDSTRGRARVLQELANGSLVDGFRAPELAESLDLCLSCKGCSSDCPAGVDMGTYKAEVLHQRYRRRLRPASHYALGMLPRWARLASRTPRLVNRLMGGTRLSRVAKRAAGVDPRRPLPVFAERTFREWFGERVAPAPGATPVLLFVDTFTDHFSPEVGRAAVRVLEAAGYAVTITEKPVCCGLTWISTGQLDGAKRQLRRTLDALGPAIADGTPVVGLEPSCTAVLRHDLAGCCRTTPAPRGSRPAPAPSPSCSPRRPAGRPPRLDGVRGRRATALPPARGDRLAGRRGPARRRRRRGHAVGGCCGLAGNFGVERGHYEVSVAVAETALLPAVREAGEDAVVLADGFSCRTQLDQLAATDGRHLAQLLADHL